MQIELVRQSIVVVAAATWPKCDYEVGAGAQGGADSQSAGIYYSASAQLQFTTSSSCIIINQLAVSPATVAVAAAAADTLNGQYVTPALSCCAHCAAPPANAPLCPTHTVSIVVCRCDWFVFCSLSLYSYLYSLPPPRSSSLSPTLPPPLSLLFMFFPSRFTLTSSIFACCNFCYAAKETMRNCFANFPHSFSPLFPFQTNPPSASFSQHR